MTHSMADPFSVQLNVAELSVMLVTVMLEGAGHDFAGVVKEIVSLVEPQ